MPPASRSTSSERYDYFVSYSHHDRAVVESLARDLKRRHVKIWWDAWEMQPGDFLRDRIVDGIDAAQNYLIVATPASLKSDWVRFELNSATIGSIEDRGVRVIPMLAGDADFSELPRDLRARLALDLRSKVSRAEAVQSLVDLAQPWRRAYEERLRALRDPARSGLSADEVRQAALDGDQRVQNAALRGALRLAGAEAVKICTARSLSLMGSRRMIDLSIRFLGDMPEEGGLLSLACTVLCHPCFVHERLEALEAAAKSSSADAADVLREARALLGSRFEPHLWAQKYLDRLAASDDEDLRIGASFMLNYAPNVQWLGPITASEMRAEELKTRIDRRVPGLHHVLWYYIT